MSLRLVAWVPAIAVMSAIGLLSHDPKPPVPVSSPDWLLHAIAFGTLALTVAFGVAGGLRGMGDGRGPWIALLASAVYGIVDEVHQGFVPGRVPSTQDWAADVAGAAIVALALVAYPRVRNRWRARRR